MYIPKIFDESNVESFNKLADRYPFSQIISLIDCEVSFLPLLRVGDMEFEGHFSRSNPQLKSLRDDPRARLIISGPHSYIPASWYSADEVVPTWNYAVAVADGIVEFLDEDELLRHLNELIDKFEPKEKGSWSIQTPSEDFISKLMNGIEAFRFKVETFECKFKFSQNRPQDQLESLISKTEKINDTKLYEFRDFSIKYLESLK